MIRGNLATRPFYNDGVIHRWLAVATLLVVAFTVYNAWQILRYTRNDATLQAQTDADQAQAAALRASAAALLQGQQDTLVDPTRAAVLEANQLIARRTFSWTALFNHLESGLPPDVRITAVRPAVQAGPVRPLGITVVARDATAIDEFMRNLESTGVFADALARDEQVNDTGEIEGAITVTYTPTPGSQEAVP